ncbi:MAG: hypothetical protein M9894_33545 [Planctomycetes bacterium]|nr:hypothetical protein [Planctomycetota bacterium]
MSAPRGEPESDRPPPEPAGPADLAAPAGGGPPGAPSAPVRPARELELTLDLSGVSADGKETVRMDPERVAAVRQGLAALEGMDASPDDTLSIVSRQVQAMARAAGVEDGEDDLGLDLDPDDPDDPDDGDGDPELPPPSGRPGSGPSPSSGPAPGSGPGSLPVAGSPVTPGPPPAPGPPTGSWSSRTWGPVDLSRLVTEATGRFDPAATVTLTRALVAPQVADLRAQIVRLRAELQRLDRDEGMDTAPLDGRLIAAEHLLEQGEVGPAELLVEELAVLVNVMAEAGELTPGPDPLEGKVAAIVAGAFQQLLQGDLFAAAVGDKAGRLVSQAVDGAIAGPGLQEAVARLLERRLAGLPDEPAFQERLAGSPAAERATRALLEPRLEALLRDEAFRRAAAEAVAARPRALLDRPELLARVEAVARRCDRDLVGSSALRERVAEAARAAAARLAPAPAAEAPAVEPAPAPAPGPGVTAPDGGDERLRALVRQELARAFETPAAAAALDARAQAWAANLVQSAPFQEGLEARVRRLVDELVHGELFLTELDLRTREVLKTPEFRLRLETLLRGSPALAEVLDERLERSRPLERRLDERLAQALPAALARAAAERAEAERARGPRDEAELMARVDEVARRRTEALVEAAGFKAAVDARVRAASAELSERLGREVDQRVQAGAADLAQAAADRALEAPALRARAEAVAARTVEPLLRELQAKVERLTDAQAALGRKVEALVQSALAEGGAVDARLRQLAEEAARRSVDEAWLRRVVQREIANREALATAKLSGGDGIDDPMTALLRSEAVRKIVGEHISAIRRERQERKAQEAAGPGEPRAVRSKRTTERVNRSELDTQLEPPSPRRPDRQRRPPPPTPDDRARRDLR